MKYPNYQYDIIYRTKRALRKDKDDYKTILNAPPQEQMRYS